MNTRRFMRLATIVAALLFASSLDAQTPPGLQPDGETIDTGLIRGWFSNTGRNFNNPNTGNPGLEFPKGSTNTACFSQYTWFVTQFNDNPNDLRSSSSPNSAVGVNDFQAGRLLRRNVVDSLFDARILKINRGDTEFNNPDYKRWLDLCNQTPPLAPYKVLRNAINGDSVIYENLNGVPVARKVAELDNQGRRVPEILGTQTLWMVYNDLRGTGYGGKRNNMEMEQTIFAFGGIKRADQIVFLRYKLTNKSDSLWKNAYFAVSADVDIGATGADLVGSDSTLGLGYIYNGTGSDPQYGTNPPATGFSFVKGTRITGANGNYLRKADGRDSTMFTRAVIRVAKSSSGSLVEEVEPVGIADIYKFMQGKNRVGGAFTGTYPGSTFMFPGDPNQPFNAATNIIDDEGRASDKRMMISIGPFDMQPGESQEVYVAACVGQASLGGANGNLRSTGEVRYIATVAQNLADLDFQLYIDNAPPVVPSVPSLYSLSQNYPNPFNPVTTIKYELPEDVTVSLQVYDMSGRKVAVLVDKQAQKAGIYEAKLDASRLASGVYLYRLKAGPYFKTRKLVVVK